MIRITSYIKDNFISNLICRYTLPLMKNQHSALSLKITVSRLGKSCVKKFEMLTHKGTNPCHPIYVKNNNHRNIRF